MQTFFWFLLVVHVLIALAIIGLVLLQHGKGADVGAAFGSGASGSLFGATGSANFLSRSTAVLAALFFASSLALAYLATTKPKAGSGGVMDSVPTPSQSSVPAVPAPAAPSGGGAAQSEKPAPSPDSKASEVPK
jgi:preprotein translocase subunit SecG